jgi:hypothetical protein
MAGETASFKFYLQMGHYFFAKKEAALFRSGFGFICFENVKRDYLAINNLVIPNCFPSLSRTQ